MERTQQETRVTPFIIAGDIPDGQVHLEGPWPNKSRSETLRKKCLKKKHSQLSKALEQTAEFD